MQMPPPPPQTPIGVATILDRLVDFGDCLEVAIFFKPEHESVRSTMLGRGVPLGGPLWRTRAGSVRAQRGVRIVGPLTSPQA